MSTIRDMIRAEIRAVIKEEIQGAVRDELGVGPTAPAPAAPEPSRRYSGTFHHEWPRGTIIRLNGAFYGPVAAKDTKLGAVWATVREYLKPAQEIERAQLTRDIADLMGVADWKTLTPAITTLLKRRALLAVEVKTEAKS